MSRRIRHHQYPLRRGGRPCPPARKALLVTLRRGRCLHRPARRHFLQPSVGADAYIGPPHHISCKKLSLRSQCAHWLWQSAPPPLKMKPIKAAFFKAAFIGLRIERKSNSCKELLWTYYTTQTSNCKATSAHFFMRICHARMGNVANAIAFLPKTAYNTCMT